MASVRLIAEEAGVSISTVSRALNNDPAVRPETRDLILSVANRFGYAPTVGRRGTTTIGFGYTQEMTLSHPFDSAVLEGAVQGLDECRFDLVVLNIRRDKLPGESFTQFFMRKGVRGVILRTMAATRDTCREIAATGFPHVVISERFDTENVNFIDADSREVSTKAVEYLINLGHRRIAFAMHAVPDRDHLDRFQGYKEALHRNGLPLEQRFVFKHPFTLAGGATVMKMIVSMADRPTALYCADPLHGVGAVRQAHELGVRIPQDFSLIGFDDTDMRLGVYPTLTAVCQDACALGCEASRWLVRTITGQHKERLQKTLPTFFEVNESTGRVAPGPIHNNPGFDVLTTRSPGRSSRRGITESTL